jgi:hypothetical protein
MNPSERFFKKETHLPLNQTLVRGNKTPVVAIEQFVHLVGDRDAVRILVLETVGAHPDARGAEARDAPALLGVGAQLGPELVEPRVGLLDRDDFGRGEVLDVAVYGVLFTP